MAVEAERLLATFEARFTSLEKALDKAVGKSQKSFADIEKAGTKAGDALAKVGSKGAPGLDKFNKSVGEAKIQTSNLAAQLQDIAVQLQGGSSPFTVALQQGTQIQAALGNAGAGAAVRALGGAFTSLVNPVGLATIGLIAAGGAAVQYFGSVFSGGKDSEEALEKEAKLIGAIVDKWGEALPALKRYYDERQRRADEGTRDQATQGEVDRQYADVQQAVKDARVSIADIVTTLQQAGVESSEIVKVQRAFESLAGGVDKTDASVDALTAAQKAISDAYNSQGIPDTNNYASSLGELAAQLKQVIDRTKELRKENEALDLTSVSRSQESKGGRVRYGQVDLPATAPRPDLLGPGDVGPNSAIRNFDETLRDAIPAIDAFVDRVIHAESRGKADAKNPNSSATGAGQFIESTWLDLFRKYYPERAADMGRSAILELRKDATTSRVLIEAYAKENALVLQKAGVHVDEAALQLAHFLGAGDAAKVLRADPGTPLAGLISSKSIAANPTVLGGGRTVDDALIYARGRASGGGGTGAGSGSRKKTPAELFAGDKAQVEARIAVLNAELEAQSKLNPLVKDYGFEVEKAKVQQQLLNEAKKAGLEITPELSASIDVLATNYAKVSAASAQMRESQQNLVQSAQMFNDLGRDVLGGFINDLRQGKTAAEALQNALGRLADRLLDMALDSIFGGGIGGNGTGGFGKILAGIFGKRAGGGPVTAGQPYLVGEKRPEVIVPNQSGRVLTAVPPKANVRGGRRSSVFAPVTNLSIGAGNNVTRDEVQSIVDRSNRKLSQQVRGSVSGWVSDDNERYQVG